VRIKAIVLGAIAALALATLTANAGTSSTHRVSGSLVSLVAATTTVTKAADREAVTAAARSTASEKASEPSQKPVVAIKSVAPSVVQVSAACQQAIDTLKALRQADVAEDTAERTQKPLSGAAITTDRAEDLADAQQWKQALVAVRTACMPLPTPACQAALASLKALAPANRPESWSELVKSPSQFDLAGARAAFAAVKAACGHRD
jgi:hypothetical protein